MDDDNADDDDDGDDDDNKGIQYVTMLFLTMVLTASRPRKQHSH